MPPSKELITVKSRQLKMILPLKEFCEWGITINNHKRKSHFQKARYKKVRVPRNFIILMTLETLKKDNLWVVVRRTRAKDDTRRDCEIRGSQQMFLRACQLGKEGIVDRAREIAEEAFRGGNPVSLGNLPMQKRQYRPRWDLTEPSPTMFGTKMQRSKEPSTVKL